MELYKGNSSYLSSAFLSTDLLVKRAETVLAGVEYDTMIGIGLSGGLVVPTLARLLNKEFALIRKDGDSSHRERTVEGTIGERWIFVDDFVSSGETLRKVKLKMEEVAKGNSYGWTGFTTTFVGTYQYARENFLRPGQYD
jgi:adenine/guanine phosphoribosyltransferase-like PRPP-binding protein